MTDGPRQTTVTDLLSGAFEAHEGETILLEFPDRTAAVVIVRTVDDVPQICPTDVDPNASTPGIGLPLTVLSKIVNRAKEPASE